MNLIQRFLYERARRSWRARTAFRPGNSESHSFILGFGLLASLGVAAFGAVIATVYPYLLIVTSELGSVLTSSPSPEVEPSSLSFIFTFGASFGAAAAALTLVAYCHSFWIEAKCPEVPDIFLREEAKLHPEVQDATKLISEIETLAKNSIILNDNDASDLASSAAELYDNFIFDLHLLFKEAPEAFAALYLETKSETPLTPAASFLKGLFSSLDVLSQVKDDLNRIIQADGIKKLALEKAKEERLEAERKIAAEAQEQAELLAIFQAEEARIESEAKLEAFTLGRSSRSSSLKSSIEESLAEVKLRDEIKERSSREVEEFIKFL